jgi:hypothetical protein
VLSEHDRAGVKFVSLLQDGLPNRQAALPDAGLRIEARPARTAGSLFGLVASALLALRVDLLEIQRGNGKPGVGPRQHFRKSLPHGQHNRRLAADELARLIDCRLRVGRAVVTDQDQAFFSRFVPDFLAAVRERGAPLRAVFAVFCGLTESATFARSLTSWRLVFAASPRSVFSALDRSL